MGCVREDGWTEYDGWARSCASVFWSTGEWNVEDGVKEDTSAFAAPARKFCVIDKRPVWKIN